MFKCRELNSATTGNSSLGILPDVLLHRSKYPCRRHEFHRPQSQVLCRRGLLLQHPKASGAPPAFRLHLVTDTKQPAMHSMLRIIRTWIISQGLVYKHLFLIFTYLIEMGLYHPPFPTFNPSKISFL